VPEYEHATRNLPAAHLSADEFRQIDAVLGSEYREPHGYVEWEFYRRKGARTNSSENLDEILQEVEDKKGISGFSVYAEDELTSIEIYGGPDGSWIDYHARGEAIGRTLEKVHRIEGIFRDHVRAILNKIPGFSSPNLMIGQPTYNIQVSRDEIIQAAVTRSLITLVTAPVSFGVGLFLGWITSPPNV
jgi:hypothetical protein